MKGRRLAIGACVVAWGCSPPGTGPRLATRPAAVSDLQSARELDRQGVQAFREERFGDAIAYFRSALEHGGPSSELWNIARCEERRGEPQAADRALLAYLARDDLSGPDRDDALREEESLRARASTLTVVTEPAGASIWIDGERAAGETPLSVQVSPGAHTLAARRPGYADAVRRVDARLGRAIVVSVDLSRAEK
ncbi:MAG: PEGA domain-containing protein [Polyangiaceae bacterium]|nr:PEGA domain-containing protein [Polyangiaceae bacterium]